MLREETHKHKSCRFTEHGVVSALICLNVGSNVVPPLVSYKLPLPVNHSLPDHLSCYNNHLLSCFRLFLPIPSSPHIKSILLAPHIYITSNRIFITNRSLLWFFSEGEQWTRYRQCEADRTDSFVPLLQHCRILLTPCSFLAIACDSP